jgi:hypothetical protein
MSPDYLLLSTGVDSAGSEVCSNGAQHGEAIVDVSRRFITIDFPLSSKGKRTVLRCGNTYDLEGVNLFIQKQPSLH